jgi:hypothetical protein
MLKIVENRDEWKAGEELLLLDEIAREGARRIHYPASDQPRSPAFTDSFPRVGTAGASPRSWHGPLREKRLGGVSRTRGYWWLSKGGASLTVVGVTLKFQGTPIVGKGPSDVWSSSSM